jgi:hypothetical protein
MAGSCFDPRQGASRLLEGVEELVGDVCGFLFAPESEVLRSPWNGVAIEQVGDHVPVDPGGFLQRRLRRHAVTLSPCLRNIQRARAYAQIA